MQGAGLSVRGSFFAALLVTFAALAFSPSFSQAATPFGPEPAGDSKAKDPEAVGNSPKIQIVGGSETTFEQHPWLVEITLNGQHFCGGALVHPMLVLTAAHCLWSGENSNWWPNLGTYQAFTGRSMAGTGGEQLNIASWGGAENYQPLDAGGTGGNDYGFIALSSPSSRPILKIAGPDEASVWRPGRTGLVAGFGNISQGGAASPVLKAVSVPILEDSLCGAADSYGTDFNPGNMLCAGVVAGGSGTCQGDSGGPLTVPIDGGGRRIVGVVSWADGCGKPNKPTIYTRVAGPAVSGAVNALAKQAATTMNFPGIHADSNVLGSGAKPVGCAADTAAAGKASSNAKRTANIAKKAKASLNKAQQRLRKAKRRPAKKRARKAVNKARNQSKAAVERNNTAKKNAKSAAAKASATCS